MHHIEGELLGDNLVHDGELTIAEAVVRDI